LVIGGDLAHVETRPDHGTLGEPEVQVLGIDAERVGSEFVGKLALGSVIRAAEQRFDLRSRLPMSRLQSTSLCASRVRALPPFPHADLLKVEDWHDG
jgi:hypothetical protein